MEDYSYGFIARIHCTRYKDRTCKVGYGCGGCEYRGVFEKIFIEPYLKILETERRRSIKHNSS